MIAPTCAEADVGSKVLAVRPNLIAATMLAALVTSPEGDRASAAWPS